MVNLPKTTSALLHIATFAVLGVAQNLAFDSINFHSASGGSNLPYFNVGDEVTISWTTPFVNTTLVVFQELSDKTTDLEVLAVAYSNTQTTKRWQAGALHNNPLAGSKFHFFLQNSDNAYCAGCYINSRVFLVKPSQVVTKSSSQSSSTTTSSTSTSSTSSRTATAASSSAAAAAAGAAASQSAASAAAAAGAQSTSSQSTPSSSKGSSNNLAIPLGVGLGAGIPALLGIVAIFFLWLRKRRQRKEQREGRPLTDSSPGDSGASSWSKDAQMREKDEGYSRESRALGPRVQGPTPTWQHQAAEQEQEAYEQAELERLANSKRRSSTKYDYTPFRPSMPTHTEANEENRRSWMNQFDFERPGSKDDDEMSQLRAEIRRAPSRPTSAYSASAYSTHSHSASARDWAEIPEVPQPVYTQGADENWPLR